MKINIDNFIPYTDGAVSAQRGFVSPTVPNKFCCFSCGLFRQVSLSIYTKYSCYYLYSLLDIFVNLNKSILATSMLLWLNFPYNFQQTGYRHLMNLIDPTTLKRSTNHPKVSRIEIRWNRFDSRNKSLQSIWRKCEVWTIVLYGAKHYRRYQKAICFRPSLPKIPTSKQKRPNTICLSS